MTRFRDTAHQLADITGHAFATDPFNLWVFGNRARMESVFEAEAKSVFLPRAQTHIIEDKAAMMWSLPDEPHDMKMSAGMALLAKLMVQGGPTVVMRTLAATLALGRAFPDHPVTYLHTIAVRPTAQGEGLGGRLMRRFTADCDRTGSMGWLESSNPDNAGFYRNHGFRTHRVITIARGAPPMELMRRPIGAST